ncbi:hypothetical protein ES703_38816 [subsurface metagenome]
MSTISRSFKILMPNIWSDTETEGEEEDKDRNIKKNVVRKK